MPSLIPDCGGAAMVRAWAEILGHGEYGTLVPIGDDAALAAGVLDTLAAPPAPERQTGRAAVFSLASAAERYADILEETAESSPPGQP